MEGNDVVNEQYYELVLFDPATPSFISFPKSYIGDKRSLMAVADKMESAGDYQETVDGIRSYFDGKTDAMHTIAFQRIPVLRPVKVLESTALELGEKECDHINTWGYNYHMRFKSAAVSQILISVDGVYRRFVRAIITDWDYQNCKDDWWPIGAFIMGNAFVLDIQERDDGGCVFSNLLYVGEDVSESLEEQQQKMQDPNAVIFDSICDEVFGNG